MLNVLLLLCRYGTETETVAVIIGFCCYIVEDDDILERDLQVACSS